MITSEKHIAGTCPHCYGDMIRMESETASAYPGTYRGVSFQNNVWQECEKCGHQEEYEKDLPDNVNDLD
jgi:Zn ribbon nucleic-acid-binding protein